MQAQLSSDMEDDELIHISTALLAEAQAILEDRGGIDQQIKIPSAGNEVSAVLSPTPEGIIALEELVHRGKKYYLGIPDGSRAVDA